MRLHLERIAILSALLALAAGCSVESDEGPSMPPRAGSSSNGSGGAPSPPDEPTSESLHIVGDEMLLRLGFGQSVDLSVQLLGRDGGPMADEAIAFDLVGRPEDSSLSRLVATTNRDGIAGVTLLAASSPVMFQVRASSRSAEPVSFSVSVSGSGFGTLVVTAPYEGARTVDERFVLALPDARCEQARYRAGDPRIVLAPAEDTASLVALPAGRSYAVLAVARSAGGAELARGCAETAISTQADNRLTVLFEDLPLALEQTSSLEVTMEAGSAAATLGSAIRRAVGTLVRTTATGQTSTLDAEGRFWLDSLDTVLRGDDTSDAWLELADTLAMARLEPMGSKPESSLAALLEVNAEGAGLAGAALAGYVRDSLDSIVLYAELGFDGDETSAEISVRPLRMAALPLVAGGEPPSVRLTNTEPATLAFVLQSEVDQLELETLELSPRLGALAIAALDRAIVADDTLMALAGCTSIEEWLRKQTFTAACDERCVREVCALSMSRLLEVSIAALEDQDEQRPRATLTGSLALRDEDGDLLAEHMEAERIDGVWPPAPGATLGDTLRGAAIARGSSTTSASSN